MPNIKVLSVNTSNTNGGAARAAYRIHQGVKTLGVDSRMFVKDKQQKDDSIISLGEFTPKNLFFKIFDWVCQKVKNKIQHYKWDKYPNRSKLYLSDSRGTNTFKALEKLDYDVLHLHWINQRFIKLSDLSKVNKPIVWTLHDSWPFCGVCHYFFDCEKYKTGCKQCQYLNNMNIENDLSTQVWNEKFNSYKNLNLHIVTPSKWLGDCTKESALFSRFPISVIPNCLDTDIFRPLEENEISLRWAKFSEKSLEKTFVLYGAVNAATDQIKGFANLLSALQILEKQGKVNFELIVFGANESDLKIDVNIQIHYVGYVSDTNELVSLYNLASVMVVPSLTENLSCAIMESLSCETPVCAFNIGGNGDMIDHKQNGYLAKEQDNKDLANGIVWCLENNKNRTLSINARNKVLSNYTIDIVAKQYKDLYKSLVVR